MSISITPSSGAPTSSPPSSSVPSTFNIRVNEHEQEVVFFGVLRPFVADQMVSTRKYVERAARDAARSGPGVLRLNFKRLKHMNNVAFLELNRIVKWAAEKLPNLEIKLIISSVIPWAIRKFEVMAELHPNITVEVYDNALYPIQQVIEDVDFINVLRTQEKIVWDHEGMIFSSHGLRPGMRVADVGCGLGELAIRLQADFRPEYIVGIDHSRNFLRYAQERVKSLGLENVEYQYGDATNLLQPDNSFDFVACRLVLQVFHQPQRLVQELYRVCKPGGRVYITNEMMSSSTGYPNQESIRRGYQRFLELSRMVGMDFDIGVRTRAMLVDAGFEDVRGNVIEINNMNTDCQDFVSVVESWIHTTAQVAETARAEARIHEELSIGLRDHIAAIKSDHGFATWPIFAGSGRKPFRST
jgi:ubiquinone/menaquinone biosynthesis C-methylase UbiE